MGHRDSICRLLEFIELDDALVDSHRLDGIFKVPDRGSVNPTPSGGEDAVVNYRNAEL